MAPRTLPQEPLYVSVPEAARLLVCHPVTIRRAISSGALPAIRVGRNWRIPFEAIRPDSALVRERVEEEV